ncbi:S-layer homology domain-containing protein [Planococcus sp. 107-1]|uniref:S-layer homology domain-containing protein n=1 Tax=Planococcus sp. 107-1 TaxID=2908840 RepID=UPI001F24CB2C|nr:S-layer homology domain-containing protein [Planococcus sp. 107-1]UJF27286.1 S-layer homology domain-containing protein [Planococcus sp. 107-1]
MKTLLSFAASIILAFSMFSLPASAVVTFDDVPATHGFAFEIIYLHEQGIVSGYDDGTFRPNATVSRAQAIVMIGRALELDGTKRKTPFKDVGAGHPASGYIDSGVKEGIIFGFPDNTFRPNAHLNRGQAAMVLDRAFDFPAAPPSGFLDMGANTVSNEAVARLAHQGVAKGFPDNRFRPSNPVTRAQFAAFLARAIEPTFIEDKRELLATANEILGALQGKKFNDVAKYVSSSKGLVFCPYSGGCLDGNGLTFSKNQVSAFMADQQEYEWGFEDGSGFPIRLTPAAYYDEYLMDAAYQKKERYGRTDQPMTREQITERFPNATIVEFYNAGSAEFEYMDWQNLNMVFEKNSEGKWILVAIVNNRWTI